MLFTLSDFAVCWSGASCTSAPRSDNPESRKTVPLISAYGFGFPLPPAPLAPPANNDKLASAMARRRLLPLFLFFVVILVEVLFVFFLVVQ